MTEVDVRCSHCGRPFENSNCVACISGRIMGDGCTDCYYWCEACAVYTVQLIREVFVGPEIAHHSEPISKEEGDRRLALIRSCPEPGDERCRCEYHRAYFKSWLD